MFRGTDERHSAQVADSQPSLAGSAPTHRRRKHSRVIAATIGTVIILAGIGTGGWLFLHHRVPTNGNPFSASVMASIKCPLYYPTRLPTGYKLDPKSVNVPSANVVVVDMVGPNGQKIYLSEEPRSATFNLGGFYKTFSNMHATGVSDGVIAAGYVNKTRTEVVSRANSTTWLLANTNARIPFDQLTALMKSIKLAT